MHITPISQKTVNYNPSKKIDRQNYYAKNKESADTIAFKGMEHRLDTIASVLGVIFGAILIVLGGLTKCNNKSNDIYEGRDSVYYDSRLSSHIDSIMIGTNDTLTQAQIEQKNKIIERKNKAFADIPYETPERDYAERMAYNQVDSVTLPSSDKGKEITYFEEAQILLNSEDSVKTKFPDKEIQVRL